MRQITTPALIVLLAVLSGCAVTPQLQLNDDNLSMKVDTKVPLISIVEYSPDGKNIVTGGLGGVARLWDLATAKEIKKFVSSTEKLLVSDIAFSPDGKSIAVSTQGLTKFTPHVTTLWDVQTGTQSRVYKEGFGGRLSFSPDGKSLLGQIGGFSGGALHIVDVETGALKVDVGAASSLGQGGFDGIFSPDGKYVFVWGSVIKNLIASPVYSARLLDASTGSVVWTLPFACDQAAFSPDGKHLLMSLHKQSNLGADFKTSFKLFDTESGAELNEFGHVSTPGGAFSNVSRVLYAVHALAFSPDGSTFISGNLRGEYHLWDPAAGSIIQSFKTVDEAVGTVLNTAPAVGFSPDGRTAVTASLASSRIYNVTTGEELATMISFEDGEWLVTTLNGYYNASEKGDEYLNVSVDGEPYTISQLRESFFRPDLVMVALAGEKIAGLMNIADVKPPPSIAIINTPMSVASDQVVVTLQVSDQGGGVGDVRLYRNGTAVMLEKTRGLQVASISTGGQMLQYTVSLEAGTNTIRAIAFNADNTMQSRDAAHVIVAQTAVRKPSLHALVVGIQEYENPKLTLRYPIADANLFADSLVEHAKDLFETTRIVRLTTREQTTSTSIAAALNQMRSEVGPNDLFVFYVASHGTVDDGEYFLITSNVGATSTERLKRDAMSQNNLKELLSNIPASKKLIVLDTCNAGALGDVIQVAMLTRGMSEDTAFKVLSRAVGSTILSAANSQQEALEGYRGHGLFTYVITEGLQGKADLDRDGFVKTTELANYIEDEVPELAEKLFQRKQFPVASPSGQGFPVVRAVH